MSPRAPFDLVFPSVGFNAALLARDPVRAAECFAPEGRLLTPDGTEVSGRRSITEVLRQLSASNLRLAIEPGRTVRSGPVALCSQRFFITATDPDTEPFERSFSSNLVLHRAGDRWQLQIAAPWGWA